MTDDLRREAMQAYCASIRFMDAQVGRVRRGARPARPRRQHVIVLTSDHGYHMYEHGLWQKMSLFENSARVPLIDRRAAARRRTASRRTALAELVDLYPDARRSVRPEGAGLPRRREPAAGARRSGADGQGRGLHAVRGAASRTATASARPAGATRCGTTASKGEQLFDMQADRGETKNLADDPQHAGTVAELTKLVADYREHGNRTRVERSAGK